MIILRCFNAQDGSWNPHCLRRVVIAGYAHCKCLYDVDEAIFSIYQDESKVHKTRISIRQMSRMTSIVN